MWSQNNKIIIIGPGNYEKKLKNHPTPMITIIYHGIFFQLSVVFTLFSSTHHLSCTCLLLLSFQFVYFCSSSFFFLFQFVGFLILLVFQIFKWGIETRIQNSVWWIHEIFVAPKFFLGFKTLANFSLRWFQWFDSRSLHYESIMTLKL